MDITELKKGDYALFTHDVLGWNLNEVVEVTVEDRETGVVTEELGLKTVDTSSEGRFADLIPLKIVAKDCLYKIDIST